MVHVVGHWEIGYMTPIIEAPFWGNTLREFEVDVWWMSPVSGIRNIATRVDFKERHNF